MNEIRSIQVYVKPADTMSTVSRGSMDSSMAIMAPNIKSVQNAISIAMMRQSQEQKAFTDALLNKARQGPMPDGTGRVINIAA
ncbi:MAG TPA: hypothetical protein VF338_11650 [Leptolinea sp.]